MGDECAEFERQLAKFGHERHRKGTMGRIRIKFDAASYKHIAVRAAAADHLGVSGEEMGEKKQLWIARHHFHPDLVDCASVRQEVRTTSSLRPFLLDSQMKLAYGVNIISIQ